MREALNIQVHTVCRSWNDTIYPRGRIAADRPQRKIFFYESLVFEMRLSLTVLAGAGLRPAETGCCYATASGASAGRWTAAWRMAAMPAIRTSAPSQNGVAPPYWV